MKQLIKYTNSRGEEISFSNEKPVLLQAIDGLSESEVNNISYKNVGQDGETYNYSELGKKQLTISFILFGDDADHILKLRELMLRVFNPKNGEGTLHYKYGGLERSIKCIPDGTPTIPLKGNKNIADGSVILLAHNPFFTEPHDIGEEISTWIGGWKFKFSLPFRFKQKGDTKRNITNNGHIETPLEIIFKGPAVNPSITNYTTGEFIKVNRTLTTDDTLVITTEFGNKTVEISRNEGEKINAFNFIDLDSTFFNLQVGDNLLEYSTENLEPQSVEIKYKNRYLGI
ncbi:MAG: phage tail family protein [Clostridium sp.]